MKQESCFYFNLVFPSHQSAIYSSNMHTMKKQDTKLRIRRETFKKWRESSYQKMAITKDKVKSHWAEFCAVAPIHGVRYLAEPKRPFVEKLWWSAVLVVSIVYATLNAWEQYEKLLNTPIQEFPEVNYGNLTDIPFPAVTICDNRKSHFMTGLQDHEIKPYREAKLFICGDPHPLAEETNFKKLLEMSLPFDQSCDLSNAFLKKNWTNCTSMFRRIVTDVGVCYTFNMFTRGEIFTVDTQIDYDIHGQWSDWDVEAMSYRPGTPRTNPNGCNFSSPFPKRAENELTVTLYNELLTGMWEILYCDSSDIPGYKIILHNPHEVPMVGHRRNVWSPTEFNETSIGQYFILPMERKLQLIVEPKLIKASQELKQFEPSHRNCYFKGEKKLAYFRQYSLSNCELECVTNLTLSECNCTDFYMPRLRGTKLCDRSNLGCILAVTEDWKRRGGKNCSCLDSCTHIEYHAKAWYTYSPDEGEIKWNDTSLSVVMGVNVFLATERKPMYTKVDFYASCGGLFGLFCGMSIISFVEITYHGTFRVIANLLSKWNHRDSK